MPVPAAFLLALQAGGMVVDFMGKQKQVNQSKHALALEKQQINENIQLSRLQYENESLASLRELRQNLGTQMAMSAARGGGANVIGMQESISAQGSDERIRKINMLAQETAYKTQKKMAELHQKTTENNIWNEFKNSLFQAIPTSTQAWQAWGNAFKSGGKSLAAGGFNRSAQLR